MRYVITKAFGETSCYEVLEEDEKTIKCKLKCVTNPNKIKYGYIIISKKNIVKQAETIVELVDGFWWENSNYKDPIFIPNYEIVKDKIKAWLESDEKTNSNSIKDINIYGSVYVKGKGWKHVTKVIILKDYSLKDCSKIIKIKLELI